MLFPNKSQLLSDESLPLTPLLPSPLTPLPMGEGEKERGEGLVYIDSTLWLDHNTGLTLTEISSLIQRQF